MSALVGFMFSSGGLVVSFLIVAVWLSLRPSSAAARRALMSAAAFYFLASVYTVPFFVGQIALVRRFHPFSMADVPSRGRTAMVVLGGGGLNVRGWDEGQAQAQAPESVARVLEAVRVYTLVDPRWVISSGGLLDPTSTDETSAVAMRDLMVQWGIPATRIILESQSGTTHDEAVLIAPMLRSIGAENVVLVTSDIHMRRSLGAFRAQGWQPSPAVAPDPHVRDPIGVWIVPTDIGLRLSGEVVHELVGIPYYAVRGWWTR